MFFFVINRKTKLKKMSELVEAAPLESLSDLSLDTSTKEVQAESEKDTENKKREAFGNRHLTEKNDVFEFNAWYYILNLTNTQKN